MLARMQENRKTNYNNQIWLSESAKKQWNVSAILTIVPPSHCAIRFDKDFLAGNDLWMSSAVLFWQRLMSCLSGIRRRRNSSWLKLSQTVSACRKPKQKLCHSTFSLSFTFSAINQFLNDTHFPIGFIQEMWSNFLSYRETPLQRTILRAFTAPQ
jgi:hypothetical protein